MAKSNASILGQLSAQSSQDSNVGKEDSAAAFTLQDIESMILSASVVPSQLPNHTSPQSKPDTKSAADSDSVLNTKTSSDEILGIETDTDTDIKKDYEQNKTIRDYVARMRLLQSPGFSSPPLPSASPSSPTAEEVSALAAWCKSKTPTDELLAEEKQNRMQAYINSHPDWFETFGGKKTDTLASVKNKIDALISCYCRADFDDFEKSGGETNLFEIFHSIDLETDGTTNSKYKQKPMLKKAQQELETVARPLLTAFESAAAPILPTPLAFNNASSVSILVKPKATTPTKGVKTKSTATLSSHTS